MMAMFFNCCSQLEISKFQKNVLQLKIVAIARDESIFCSFNFFINRMIREKKISLKK